MSFPIPPPKLPGELQFGLCCVGPTGEEYVVTQYDRPGIIVLVKRPTAASLLEKAPPCVIRMRLPDFLESFKILDRLYPALRAITN